MMAHSERTTLSGLNKWTGRTWLNLALAVLLAATILSRPGADGIHAAAGMLLLVGCSIHVAWHGRWIRVVVLDTSTDPQPARFRQRYLFWSTLISGFLCGLSGAAFLLPASMFLPALCCLHPIHLFSGLAFLGLNIYHLVVHRNWFARMAAGIKTRTRP